MAASLLAVAVDRKRWDVVALCLLVAVSEAAAKLPPEAVEHLLDLLEELPGDRRER